MEAQQTRDGDGRWIHAVAGPRLPSPGPRRLVAALDYAERLLEQGRLVVAVACVVRAGRVHGCLRARAPRPRSCAQAASNTT